MVFLNKVLRIKFEARKLWLFGGKKASCQCDQHLKENEKCKNVAASPEDPISLECTDFQPRVIILGAGIAGLSAAHHLIEHGCENVVLYEATDKIGGRIQSNWLGDTSIDLGPNTINGCSIANSFFNLVNREDLLSTPLQRYDPDKCKFISPDGRIFDDTSIPNDIFNKILDQAANAQSSGKGYNATSIRDFISLRIQQELLNYPDPMRYDAERMLFGMLNYVKNSTGAEIDNLSPSHFVANKRIPGGDVRVDRGFSTVLSGLLSRIPRNNIKLNHRVRYVNWCPGKVPQVTVSCGHHHTDQANFLIIALPLGVLKRESKRMFTPELPEPKQRAIDVLGVGHINRIYLEYLHPWWAPEKLSMRIAWSPDELIQWKTWAKGIGSIENAYNSNRVIMLTIGGKEAVELEKYTEIEVAIETTRFLRMIMNSRSIPYPNNICLSRWSTSEDTAGGRVYIPVGVSETVIGCFQTSDSQLFPCGQISPLLFAGEHTHDYYFGTLHGTRNSGLREANKILRFAKENKHLLCGESSANERCASNPC
ncbi:hypothetical protein O3M35_012750 [Rhynocoris fuscipes]|uniref:Amine oxidase domain-containing protein n=1 Tax=Rhynocoris fuscipes TaxID=488301 RepID=A0AAW1CUP7_9HEMI